MSQTLTVANFNLQLLVDKDGESTSEVLPLQILESGDENSPYVLAKIAAQPSRFFEFNIASDAYRNVPLWIAFYRNDFIIEEMTLNYGQAAKERGDVLEPEVSRTCDYRIVECSKRGPRGAEAETTELRLKFDSTDCEDGEQYDVVIYETKVVDEPMAGPEPLMPCDDPSPIFNPAWVETRFETKSRTELAQRQGQYNPKPSDGIDADDEDADEEELPIVHMAMLREWQKPTAAFRIIVDYDTEHNDISEKTSAEEISTADVAAVEQDLEMTDLQPEATSRLSSPLSDADSDTEVPESLKHLFTPSGSLRTQDMSSRDVSVIPQNEIDRGDDTLVADGFLDNIEQSFSRAEAMNKQAMNNLFKTVQEQELLLNEYSQQLEEKTGVINSLEIEIGGQRGICEQQELEIELLSKLADERRTQLAEIGENAQRLFDSFKSKEAEFNAEKQQLKSEIQEMTALYGTLKTQLVEERQAHEAHLSNTNNSLNQLKKLCGDEQKRKFYLQREIRALKQSKERLEQDSELTRDSLLLFQKDNKDLRGEIEQLKHTIQVQRQQLNFSRGPPQPR